MSEEERNLLAEKMADKLPVLRKCLGISQQSLADKAGLSRSSVAKMECGRRPITWNTYLALLLIFRENSGTDQLLRLFGLYNDDVCAFLTGSGSEAG